MSRARIQKNNKVRVKTSKQARWLGSFLAYFEVAFDLGIPQLLEESVENSGAKVRIPESK